MTADKQILDAAGAFTRLAEASRSVRDDIATGALDPGLYVAYFNASHDFGPGAPGCALGHVGVRAFGAPQNVPPRHSEKKPELALLRPLRNFLVDLDQLALFEELVQGNELHAVVRQNDTYTLSTQERQLGLVQSLTEFAVFCDGVVQEVLPKLAQSPVTQ